MNHEGVYVQRYIGSTNYFPAGRAFTMHAKSPDGSFVALYGGLKVFTEDINNDTGKYN